MYIKSRELLPVDQQVKPEGGEEDEDDPRWELIRKLVEYKKFNDAAAQLQEFEARQENVFERRPVKPEFEPEAPSARGDVSVFDLINAVNSVLKRFSDREEMRDIFEDKWTVSEKIEMLRDVITQKTRLTFSALFHEATSRSEVVVTFLAVLELIRLRQIVALQAEPFGEIFIERAPEPPPAGAATTESTDSATRLDTTIQPDAAPAT
jgi:segregation and condensation protein A